MYLNEMHKQVRDMTRQFANDVIRPLAEELDRDSRFPAEIYDQMAELGLFGIGVPEELGGPGFDTVTYAIVMEELSRGYASIADQCGLIELVSSLLVCHGSDAQQEKWLSGLLSAKIRPAYCITEPEAGTDVSGIRTTAVRDGDGWVLNGGKIWIHNVILSRWVTRQNFPGVIAQSDSIHPRGRTGGSLKAVKPSQVASSSSPCS